MDTRTPAHHDGPPRRLLGIWAHPDDEAYLSAGLMARTVASGGRVTVLTATRGEKGTDDPGVHGRSRFAARRETELRTALGEVGVTDVRFMGFGDGECDLRSRDAVATIDDTIGEVEPDLIVTFGPDGITNHGDHRAVSAWTTMAWLRHTSVDLMYAAMTTDFAWRHRDLHDQLGIFADCPKGAPATVASAEIELRCSLTEDELDRKRRSLAAHRSQTEGLAAVMGEAAYRTWWREETFRRPTREDVARVAEGPRALAPVGAGS